MKIAYEEYGDGIAVVLIHGFAADHTIWKSIIRAIPNVHIFCPDLPCIGNSEGVVEKISLEYAAFRLHKWMDEKKIKKALFLGHSMGGYITQTFAQLYPENILGIGLIHSTPLADSEEKKNNRKKSADFILQNGRKKFLEMAIPGWFATQNRENFLFEIQQLTHTAMDIPDSVLHNYQIAIAERKDFKLWFENFDKPKLLVLGKNDELISYQEHQYLQQFKNISFHIIDHCGHMSMIEQKEKLVYAIHHWIQNNYSDKL